jgi:phenylalanyl-tRNA synthetase beta chain
MKVSLNWVKQYTEVRLGLDELVDKIGTQLGAVDSVTNLGERYQKAIIVKVVECEPHPNADHLSVCKIDDDKTTDTPRDDNGYITVVCGAPNVRAGILAVWLPPGSAVPETFEKEPIIIDARELRGVVSQGMLASARELALGDNHEGILVIDDAKVGQSFAERYELNDYIIDIENKMFTHRPDLFGQLGVAREIAGISHHPFKSPDWYLKEPTSNLTNSSLGLNVNNEIPDLVSRFMAQVIEGVEVKDSPLKLQTYLRRVGVKPINNIVDLTNYFMMLTGQPMHAYDYDKLRKLDDSGSATITIRLSKDKESLALLNGKTIEIGEGSITIASADKPIALGGIMGGSDTEVDNNTKNIVVEVATFDMYTIRRTSMAQGLFTEAVTRFTKGQSPFQNGRILSMIAENIIHEAGGKQGSIHDNKHDLKENEPVTISADFINAKLGTHLEAKTMAELLTNVEFEVSLKDDNLTVKAPFWRRDISIAEDLVEEVGRLYGFNNIKTKLPKRDLTPASRNAMLDLKNKSRDLLAKGGMNELLTYSFVHENLLAQVGQDKKLAYEISNAISPSLQFYRLSLLPSLLEKVHPNIKAGYSVFGLFEINNVHVKGVNDRAEPDLPAEQSRLALVIAAEDKISKDMFKGAPFYQARAYVDYLLFGLGVRHEVKAHHAHNSEAINQWVKPFNAKRLAYVVSGNELIGVIGEPSSSAKRNLKLPAYCTMLEINLDVVMELANNKSSYVKLSRFPKIEQDICFKVGSDISFKTLNDFAWEELRKLSADINSATSLYPIDIYQRDDDKTHKQITFRLSLGSYERTLTSEEANKIVSSLGEAAKAKLSAEII